MNLRAAGLPMAGIASKIHCLKDEKGVNQLVDMYGFFCFCFFQIYEYCELPVVRFASVLAPEHFQVFKTG